MKLTPHILLFFISLFLYACQSAKKEKNAPAAVSQERTTQTPITDLEFTPDPDKLTKDYMTWYSYTYYDVPLSADFIPLDIKGNKTDKTRFLQQLSEGNLVAFKIRLTKGQPVYQLFKLNTSDEGIRETMKQMANTALRYYKLEGTPLPDFHFTDLQGKQYNKASAKGKILVLKCWFIHCVACVKEFPELNQLVDDYAGHDDILFISLALDPKKDLENFHIKRPLKYKTIPDMKDYMTNKLKVTEYPTHLLIDRNGKIIKIVNRIEELTPFLKQETGKAVLNPV